MIEIKINGKNLTDILEDQHNCILEQNKKIYNQNNEISSLKSEIIELQKINTKNNKSLLDSFLSIFSSNKPSRIKESTVILDELPSH